MIKFEDEKYGKVIIFEPRDIPSFPSDPLTIKQLKLAFQINEEIKSANIVGARNIEKNIIKITKNRYGAILDNYEMEQFIRNYR